MDIRVLLVQAVCCFQLMSVRELVEVFRAGSKNVLRECDTSGGGLQYCIYAISRSFAMTCGGECPACI
jgi:hypothetical protein